MEGLQRQQPVGAAYSRGSYHLARVTLLLLALDLGELSLAFCGMDFP